MHGIAPLATCATQAKEGRGGVGLLAAPRRSMDSIVMVLYICITKYILKTNFESTSTDIGDGYFWKHVVVS